MHHLVNYPLRWGSVPLGLEVTHGVAPPCTRVEVPMHWMVSRNHWYFAPVQRTWHIPALDEPVLFRCNKLFGGLQGVDSVNKDARPSFQPNFHPDSHHTCREVLQNSISGSSEFDNLSMMQFTK